MELQDIIKAYGERVYKIVANHVPVLDVEDVCSDVFVEIICSLEKYNDKGKLKNWISKVAVRCCYDYWRKEYRKTEDSLSKFTDDDIAWFDKIYFVSSVENFLEEITKKEAKEVLDIALLALSPEDRMIVSLIYFEEKSISEVADILGFSIVNVKVRSMRVKAKLKKIILNLEKQCGAKI